jgi:CRP-like cAMP-binding protein
MKVATKFYQKNAFIFLDGKNNLPYFYIVKQGKIRISKKNSILGDSEEIKSVGYIFGIIQCLTGISDEESVQAFTDCEVFVITKDKIEELYKEHPNVILKILSEYSEILRKLDKDLIQYEYFSTSSNRNEKIFEIANKYISIGQDAKASHLLASGLKEFHDSKIVIDKINAHLKKMPKPDMIECTSPITEKKVAPKTVLFTEFELGHSFYIIKSGRVKITKLQHDKEVLLAILGDGDIFGEMAILNDKPRNATATTEAETDLMIIDKKSIGHLPSPLLVKILEFITKRIWLVEQQLICYKLPIPTARIYYLLTAKVKQVIGDPRKEFDKSFTFKFPIQELYQMLDFDEKSKRDIVEFENDKNLEFYWDSTKIRNIGALFDKNAYHFTRAQYQFNGMVDNSKK